MKKLYLFCSAGMSTSILAAAIQNVADSHNLDIEVKSFSEKDIDRIVKEYEPDCILLGPQVKYLSNSISKKFSSTRPVMVISSEDYGLINGEVILKKAILRMKNFEKEGRK